MEITTLKEDNRLFFCMYICFGIREKFFASSVIRGTIEPYGLGDDNFSGYILVDSSEVRRDAETHRSFSRNVLAGLFESVSKKIPHSLQGEMNTEVEVIHDIYKFNFSISRYERDFDHEFEMVENPLLLPDDEKLRRFVELKITFV